MSYPKCLKIIDLKYFFNTSGQRVHHLNWTSLLTALPPKYGSGSFAVFFLLKWEDKEKTEQTPSLSKHIAREYHQELSPNHAATTVLENMNKCNISITEGTKDTLKI